MEFGWNPAKRVQTLRERDIDFADVTVGFEDPDRQVWEDDRKSYGEIRHNMLARCHGRVFTARLCDLDHFGA